VLKNRKTRAISKQPKTTTVTYTKTLQVVQFEPVTISVSETYDLEPGDDVVSVRAHAYNSCAKSAVRYLNNELKRWNPEKEDE
jgi:hypothetical protein